MCLDFNDLFLVALIIELFIHFQNSLQEFLYDSSFLVQDSLHDEAPKTENSILSKNLHNSPSHPLFDASARLSTLIILEQTAKLSPIELHASRPVHSLPLIFLSKASLPFKSVKLSS
jgi:hypothetical protein